MHPSAVHRAGSPAFWRGSCPLLDALEYMHHIFHLLMEFPSSTRQDEQPSTKEDEVTQ